MLKGRGYVTRYSEAFKQKIIKEVEEGSSSKSEIIKKYGLNRHSLLHSWLRKYGKNHLLNKIVRIQMPQEKSVYDEIKKLKKEKQKLESALAQSHLKVMAFETLIEVAEEKYQIDIKKKIGTKQSLKLKKGR